MRKISFVIYTLQGLFGMVPAMYVDLAPDRNSCIWTPSMWLTLPHVVSMEVMVVLVIILFLIRGSIFQLLFGLLLLSTSILLILIPVTQNLILGHLFCVSVAVPNIWLVVVAIVVVVVNIVIEFMTTTIFRQITLYLIFCIFAAVIELRIAIVVVDIVVVDIVVVNLDPGDPPANHPVSDPRPPRHPAHRPPGQGAPLGGAGDQVGCPWRSCS